MTNSGSDQGSWKNETERADSRLTSAFRADMQALPRKVLVNWLALVTRSCPFNDVYNSGLALAAHVKYMDQHLSPFTLAADLVNEYLRKYTLTDQNQEASTDRYIA
jgi:hypothetical protein